MPRKCTICTHKKKRYIDAAIISGKKSLRKIASQYGVNYRAVTNHKEKHLMAAIAIAKENGAIKEGRTSFEMLTEMLDEVEKMYRSSNGAIKLGWFREWRASIEHWCKLMMEAENRKEKQVFSDVTPGVLAIIDKEFEK